ncbi:Bcr/CflA family drug resistance efflux transporter [Arachidicoccus ginsenosidimutans]|uniref:multidrug effflux MFS transporter n=1 Tax=Arachidicoccus sp. BS20 TaxID=1850526 RepID=UPI0007F14285|nr:multidrug effflux MFS transporter [Arachidicoccus sp. BS20]ANI88572.1 Bcr/CflA family drug resistance efflux transporter [Arachidicoccus sp. BS20]
MTKKRNGWLILLLGSLAALGPFSIDMYLPGFGDIAKDLQIDESAVPLSLSSFFIGISAGQLLYGPLLDKYGRKKPLYIGLILYIIAAISCLVVQNLHQLIIVRFVQAIGCCAASVASIAMVRDLFSVKESPKIFSLIMLVIAASPMFAPTIGGYIVALLGWKYVFVFLSFVAIVMLLASIFRLPESGKHDPHYSLMPRPIINGFLSVIKVPQFYTYVSIYAVAFAGLFAYVAASPNTFMKIYHLSKTGYGWAFAGLSVAFIGSSQVNSWMLKWFHSKQIVVVSLICQAIFTIVFLVFAINGWLNLGLFITFIALFLICLGLINPNAAALTIAPFSKNAGSASALMGALQMGLGTVASIVVSLFAEESILPIPLIMACASVISLACLFIGLRFIKEEVEDSGEGVFAGH